MSFLVSLRETLHGIPLSLNGRAEHSSCCGCPALGLALCLFCKHPNISEVYFIGSGYFVVDGNLPSETILP